MSPTWVNLVPAVVLELSDPVHFGSVTTTLIKTLLLFWFLGGFLTRLLFFRAPSSSPNPLRQVHQTLPQNRRARSEPSLSPAAW